MGRVDDRRRRPAAVSGRRWYSDEPIMSYQCEGCVNRIPDSQSDCATCSRSYPLWQDFGTATAGFATIYVDVTTRLRGIATKAPVDQRNTDWVLYMIQSFHNQFLTWQWKPATRGYLAGFHRRRSPRLFSLSGDVYLHIAYDLPRVIADSLSRRGPDDFNVEVMDPTNRYDARVLYLSAGPEFYEVLEKHATTFSVAGFFAFPAIIGRKLSALHVLGHWVIALRNTAWIHAEALCDSPNRTQLEDRLLDAVLQAATTATSSRWNPARWSIPAPILMLSMVAILAGCGAPLAFDAALLTALGVLIVYAAIIYGLTVRAIDTLGREIFDRVSPVFAEESSSTPA